MKIYAAYYDNIIRAESSSGGIFSLLSVQFEVVYGVAMSEDCYSAEMTRVEGDISCLRGSKYLQAIIGDAFKQVKQDLFDGKRVLFTGTGCQINGLKSFLQKDYTNLTTVDVICHGTPSSKLWKEYIKYQEAKYGKLKNVNFRCKDNSWQDFGMKENQLYISKDEDAYMRMFLRNYCLRPSCYECHAKNTKNADITIADFWGIESVAPEMNDGNGISLIIVRTEKGQKLFESVKEKLKWKEVSYEEGIKGNPSEYKSVDRPAQRETFFNDLAVLPFSEMEKKYAADIKASLKSRVKCKIIQIAKKLRGTAIKTNTRYGVLYTFHERDEEA